MKKCLTDDDLQAMVDAVPDEAPGDLEDTAVDLAAVPLCPECGEPLDAGRWCVNPQCIMFIPF